MPRVGSECELVGELHVRRVVVGMYQTNCYIVMDRETGEGYIIDPGGNYRGILNAAREEGLKCLGILCTHGHMDHVGAVGKVAEATGAPVYVSDEDSGILEGTGRGLEGRLGSLVVSRPGGVELIKEGDTLRLGENTIKVLRTPGHTRGSLSFLCGEYLFCGDFIFQGSVGRTDLKGGSMKQLLEAVKKEVWVLPPETRILPGHGPETCVADEKATNPYLRSLGSN
ncbi:MAG: MBL fold metallo-hydrolase [Actinobacteria bacterium]|nr:MBL fold metallo-hydrolase [Actinomycetota bacterium]MBU4402806.1 MBL fold metallo-hydrolase [Actinomycetota bacterium]MBU4443408.1 MBL fold metallo-hydrolase [Actinomycetota bacterium]